MFNDEKRGPRPAKFNGSVPPARRVESPENERENPTPVAESRGDPKGADYQNNTRPRYAGYSGKPANEKGKFRSGFRASAPVELPENMLVGRNPIREALRAGAPVEKLIVADGDLSGAARDIIALAKEKNVVVQKVERSRLDAIYPAHQGMIAYVAQAEYHTVDEMFESAREAGEDPFFVILDGVTDPHNLGAVIRSAECAGAHGVIIPERRSAGLTPVVSKAAAGALSYMKVARVANLNRVIDEIKERGVWVTAAALDGEDAFRADLTGPIAIVVGAEGDGISRLTLEKCDRRVTLPMKGHIDSLNASVAAGILLFEVMRARHGI